MAYLWQTWLATALRAEGCRVSEQSGWQSRGRPSSSGAFAPFGVLWHHTGTKSSLTNPAPTLGMCIRGRSDLPGPLCHVVIGYDGICYVIAAGRANHAGKNKGSGPIPAGDGNAQMIGFEIDYDGTQKMSGPQYQAAIKAASAVLKHFKRNETYARGHKETSTTGKWDPGGYDMNTMRADTKKQMAAKPPTPPRPPMTVTNPPKVTDLQIRADKQWLSWSSCVYGYGAYKAVPGAMLQIVCGPSGTIWIRSEGSVACSVNGKGLVVSYAASCQDPVFSLPPHVMRGSYVNGLPRGVAAYHSTYELSGCKPGATYFVSPQLYGYSEDAIAYYATLQVDTA